MEARLKADTHVHFHAQFAQDSFLDAALANLDIGHSESGLVHGMLCLTETSKANWFEQLSVFAESERQPGAGWCIKKTDEPNSLLAVDASDRVLAIIAGRQIVTAEGLEVLALGLDSSYPDGSPLVTVMRDVAQTGAIPVVPWGFGKWLGRRGALIRQIIAEPPCQYLLGDNGGRPWFFREPRLLVEGRRRGIATVCGTDPFPFAWDRHRVGSFGTQWSGGVTRARPFHDFKAFVGAPGGDASRYGPLEGAGNFIRNQVAIQARKWLGKFSPRTVSP